MANLTNLYKLYQRIGAVAAITAGLSSAYAQSQQPAQQSTVQPSQQATSLSYHYKPLPVETQPTESGLETAVVSAQIAVEKDSYMANLDEFRYRIDVSVKDKKTNNEIPVLGYTVSGWATPSEQESRDDSRDEGFIGRFGKLYSGPTLLKGVEIDVRDNDVLSTLPKDGEYFIYTEGNVIVATAKGPVAMRIPGLRDRPSFDVFSVTGTKGYYSSELVQQWLNNGFEFTKGGWFWPKRHTFVVNENNENELVLYKAGRHSGRHLAVLGTRNFDELKEIKDDNNNCSDCSVPIYEQIYLLGVGVEERGNRLIINADDINNTTKTQINGYTHLVARFDGEKLNYGTFVVDAQQNDLTQNTSINLESKIVDDINIPKIEGLFAVERVLYNCFNADRNRNGITEPDELNCLPIAKDVAYVQFVPRGYEAEAFTAGVVIGAGVGVVTGYLLSPPSTTIYENGSGTGVGSGGFSSSGTVAE